MKNWSAGDELKATDLNGNFGECVLTSTPQTIAGVKTFSSIPKITATPISDDELTHKLYVDQRVSSFSSTPQTASSSTTQNFDFVFTTTFTPKTILMWFRANGVDNGGERDAFGDAVFNGINCVLSRGFCGNVFSTWSPSVLSSNNPGVGGTSGTYGQIIISVLNVSNTGFTIRIAFTCNGTPSPTPSATFAVVAMP